MSVCDNVILNVAFGTEFGGGKKDKVCFQGNKV